MDMLAIDLAKQSFHGHGVTADGRAISRRVGRSRLVGLVESLAPTAIAMEACATAHVWARALMAMGRRVCLIGPRFVKPFFDAASRPTMRFVPVRTMQQQDLQSPHRVRDRLAVQRTSLIDHTRGLLGEYGLVYPKGADRFGARARAGLAAAELSSLARDTFAALLDELDALQARMARLDDRLVAICREDETCRRPLTLPGVGSVAATALVAAVGDASHFRLGRPLAAWIGLVVPREYPTGGKATLGGVAKRANHNLHRQLVHSARAVALRLATKADARSRWFQAAIDRRGFDKRIVAMANKMARVAWAMHADPRSREPDAQRAPGLHGTTCSWSCS